MLRKIQNVSVLGDGGWGTTLAIHISKQGYRVKLWGAFPRYIQYLNRTRKNTKFLPGIKIPREIAILDDLSTTIQDAAVIILAVPSQFAIRVIARLKKIDLSHKILLSVVKGIETNSLLRISQIIEQELGKVQLAVLSGPTIAREVVRGIPSTAVIACDNPQVAKSLQAILNSPNFRIYTNSDVVGVELGGSLKNVIAIACGVCDGLGFGTNTKAAILTRGLVEMARLGETLGAKTKTFFGLSGLGDLVTTCFSPQSRNRYVGEQLGQGKSIREIVSSMDMIAEGVPTAKAVYLLSRKYGVEMPISHEVFNIIYRKKKPMMAVSDLMTRRTTTE